MFLVEVQLPLPIFKSFHYLSESYLLPGIRVVVPFGRQNLVGIVWKCHEASLETLDPTLEYKEVSEVLEYFPLYPAKFFSLLEWISQYYHSPLGLVLKMALPSGVFKIPERKIYLTKEGEKFFKRSEDLKDLIEELKRGISLKSLQRKRKVKPKEIKEWAKLGLITVKTVIPRAKIPVEVFYRCKSELSGELKDRLEAIFWENPEVPEKVLREKLSKGEIERYLRAGYLERIEFPKTRRVVLPTEGLTNYVLTPSQRGILEHLLRAIHEGSTKPFLLHGITGSGKSLIYVELIKEILSRGKRVLFLLPEIVLTHYVERLLYEHFKGKIAVLHSALSPSQKLSEWMKILEGRADIVLGTRSAIFAPVENLGLIIVDEEHDPSYKEEHLPCRYHARDVALIRGQLEGALVLLGSATPSVKSYYYARIGKYKLLTLKERPFVSLPEIKLVKLRGFKLVSDEVQREIEIALSKGRSVFVYLNRRGYAPLVICEECGYVWSCPNCGIPLTYHKSIERLLCHYCSFEVPRGLLCPNCQGGKYKFYRAGTERIEEELQKLFPNTEILRFDRDIVSSEKRLQEVLTKLYEPYPKIIVGTQMGVHGHNFPQVNLVVVLRAEEGLFLPHYKAEERTFQLLLQAEGRAGRKMEKGKVLIQTTIPDHYVIKFALNQDYEGFFQEELLKRKRFGYPPFMRLAVFRFEGMQEDKLTERLLRLKEEMEALKASKQLNVEILGPSPAPLRKLKGLYRWQILLKSYTYKDLHNFLEYYRELTLGNIRVVLDVDPEELL
ncbi:MAG: primosomal protein N' [Caldimicrobium sp.]|nr:primosomal protein N' [Caldimicrobium sp.]MCX7873614.1 primosomal protein N' [Caldimicrobium sp.]MDW8094418.1 primosomal protein N' [Caldimicrobium sp.]